MKLMLSWHSEGPMVLWTGMRRIKIGGAVTIVEDSMGRSCGALGG